MGQATDAIRLDSKEPAAYLVRAEAHRRINRPYRALADLAVAIRLDPEKPSPYVVRAEILKRLAVAIRLDPEKPSPHVVRAEILKRRNLFDQAIADATYALTLDPRNAAAFSIRAECRSAIGDVEGANEDVQEMLLIDPTRPVPNLQRGSSPLPMASDDQRFWKDAGPSDP